MDINTIILGFLHDKDMTGYDIRQRFGMSFSFFSGLSFGSIYPALAKLEKNGLIITRVEAGKKGPNKKICRITEKGKQAFLEAMAAPLPDNRYKNPYVSRLYFFAHLPAEKRLELTEKYLGEISGNLKLLLEFRPVIRQRADPFQWLCFESGVRFMEDLIKNITEVKEGLEKLEE